MDQEVLLKAIIDNAIDGIITIDPSGIVESINPSACELFGYTSIEVIGRNINMLMPEPYHSEHDGYLKRYHQTGEAHIIGFGREVKGLRKDGSVFPFSLGVSKVQYEGRIIYTGIVHDLTREKDVEEQLKKNAARLEQLVEERTQTLQSMVVKLQDAKEEVSMSLEKEKELSQLKSRFVSMASHEFRTPLSSIQLSASLIEKYAQEYQNPNISKHVGKIKLGVGNLTNILNDFLSLERLDAGKIDLNTTPFNLVNLAEEITEEMQVLAKQNQTIIYQHTGKNSMVYMDAGLLKNSIINLISNAIKYSGENTFIEFNTELDDQQCFIVIKDNGIGIPENDQKHLFQPFFRANNTGSIPGTGLGLNIVHRYIKLMNGEIEFESAENKGTKFILIFNHSFEKPLKSTLANKDE